MKKILILQIACLLVILWSCNSDKQEINTALTGEQLDAIGFFGFDASTAKMAGDGQCIVEGDIAIDIEKVVEIYRQSEQDTSTVATDRQRVVGPTLPVPYATTSNLTFNFGPGFTNAEVSAIRSGVFQWVNGVVNLNFSQVPNGQIANVKFVLNNEMGEDSWGRSSFPTGGNLNSVIELNMTETNEDCTVAIGTCIRNLVTHELGHSLGFHHTDVGQAGGTWLLGSPGDDASSIMNSGAAGGGMAGLGLLTGPDANDFNMSSALYPSNNLVLSLVGASVTYWSHDNDFCFLHILYNQPAGNGRCFDAEIEVLKNGMVIKTLDAQEIGVGATGTMNSPKFYLPAGEYQARVKGKNYRGDFTQPGFSNTITFYKAF